MSNNIFFSLEITAAVTATMAATASFRVVLELPKTSRLNRVSRRSKRTTQMGMQRRQTSTCWQETTTRDSSLKAALTEQQSTFLSSRRPLLQIRTSKVIRTSRRRKREKSLKTAVQITVRFFERFLFFFLSIFHIQ